MEITVERLAALGFREQKFPSGEWHREVLEGTTDPDDVRVTVKHGTGTDDRYWWLGVRRWGDNPGWRQKDMWLRYDLTDISEVQSMLDWFAGPAGPAKITRATLEALGFVLGNGWNFEVWFYDSPDFWVHFGDRPDNAPGSTFSADEHTLAQLLKALLEAHDYALNDPYTARRQADADALG